MNLETAMRRFFGSAPLISLLLVSILAACGSVNVEPDYPQNDNLASEESGSIFDFFRRDEADKVAVQTAAPVSAGGLGVNALLWQSSLDTLSFMPLAAADPVGGVIIEWHDPSATDERVKINLVITWRNCAPMRCASACFAKPIAAANGFSTAASSKAARHWKTLF